MKQKLSFTYEPLTLTKLALEIYLEKNYDRNEHVPTSVRYAIYEFMKTLSDEELEKILSEYVSKDKVEAITFKDDTDCERITHYLMQTERFNDLVFMYQKQGHSGLGVADNSDKTFYPCGFSHHWQTVGNILRLKYGEYGEAFDRIMYGSHSEYNGVTREELDGFIMKNFQLVSANKTIEEHLEDR